MTEYKNDTPCPEALKFFSENSQTSAIVIRDDKPLEYVTPGPVKFEQEPVSDMANPRVTMLVNNSRKIPEDIYNAISVTAISQAAILKGEERNRLLPLCLKRDPHFKDFTAAPTTALISLWVENHILLSRFQDIVKLKVET